ncbi:MAG: zf-HC2 domain-containing protein [Deltaproteobacteria bacterium]|nr:zf-HC2 domain-containing protein [Deltaproteobacteria bacterium]MDH3383413.1 zf-HC2 domain-containing protein [Deltaproteobacteria bacterium]
MDCTKTREMIQDHIDGRLSPDAAGAVRGHLGGCRPCAAEEEELRRVGDMLRLWSAVQVGERERKLSPLWTRVRAGIEERREPGLSRLLRRWFWVPAAAVVAVVALLFYPSDGTRAPFHPKSFDVTVESLESDTATVALVDKGEGLPRVIWIIENGKT